MGMDEDPRVAAEAVYWLSAAVIRYTSQPRQLSLTGLATLASLERKGAQRISELAGVQGVAQPSMTVLIGSLEQSGLVARRPDPSDGRAVLVSLTALGEEFVAERRRAGADRLSELVGKLPAADLQALSAAVPALLRLRELQEEAMEAATAFAHRGK
ncbi:MAG TPA: MarR family transcriptional regulator [Actinospica sp.]|jgi:DNA-binding MarR family transcriptional regulator|nr:MarR family transcriptional regulator [Actinospica sp.]